jgi:hypothetical protein
MKRILPVVMFLILIAFLSQMARTAPGAYKGTEAAALSSQDQSQFRLKRSYVIGSEDTGLLATIYSCGTGSRQKEILSIWSRESEAYELQYLRTAAAGESFTKPEIFSAKEKTIIKISYGSQGNKPENALLSVAQDSSIREISAIHP